MKKTSKGICVLISLLISASIYFALNNLLLDNKNATIFTTLSCFLTLLIITESIAHILKKENTADNFYNLIIGIALLITILILCVGMFTTIFNPTVLAWIFTICFLILIVLIFFKDFIYKK